MIIKRVDTIYNSRCVKFRVEINHNEFDVTVMMIDNRVAGANSIVTDNRYFNSLPHQEKMTYYEEIKNFAEKYFRE